MHARMPRHFFNVMHSIENEEICLFFFLFQMNNYNQRPYMIESCWLPKINSSRGKTNDQKKGGEKEVKNSIFWCPWFELWIGRKKKSPKISTRTGTRGRVKHWNQRKKKKTMLLSSENTYIFSSRFKRHMRHGNVWCIPQSVIQYNDLCVMSWFVLIPFDRSIQHKKYGNKAATPTYLNMWHSSGVQYPAMVKKWRQRKVQK